MSFLRNKLQEMCDVDDLAHLIQSNGHPQEIRRACESLVARNISLNGPHTMRAPLIMAAKVHDHEAVKILLELGADVNHVSMTPEGHNRVSALMQAHWGRNEDIMITLLRAGAHDEGVGQCGLTAFQECVCYGKLEVVRYYVMERCEDLTQKTDEGKSMLQLAQSKKTKDFIKSLKTELEVVGAVAADGDAGGAGSPPKRTNFSPL